MKVEGSWVRSVKGEERGTVGSWIGYEVKVISGERTRWMEEEDIGQWKGRAD